jgi:hypothetical protein
LELGADGTILTANSATATGLEWATPAVTLTNVVTLTNKTKQLTSPTWIIIITGTIAQFNTALTDTNFANVIAGTETFLL